MRRPVQGFSVPRFSAACPKWPLFEALARPLQPVKALVEMTGQDRLQFDCFAISEPTAPPQFGQDTLYHAYMLVRPRAQRGEEAREVGASSRVCPAQNCAGRREPSLLVQGLMAPPVVPALS